MVHELFGVVGIEEEEEDEDEEEDKDKRKKACGGFVNRF